MQDESQPDKSVKLKKYLQAAACFKIEEDLKAAKPEDVKDFLEYHSKVSKEKNEFISCIKKIIKWPKLTTQQTIEVEKWLNESFIKIFSKPEFASDCEKMFVEVGVKDRAGKVLLTKGKGGPLFAVMDVLKYAGAFVNPSKPSDKTLLDWFNPYLGTDFQEIKRTTTNENRSRYDAAIIALRDSFPTFIDYQTHFAKSFPKKRHTK